MLGSISFPCEEGRFADTRRSAHGAYCKIRVRGYKVDDVDGFFKRLAIEVDSGRSSVEAVEQARFRQALRGYDIKEVDQFLEQIIASHLDHRSNPPVLGRRQFDSSRDPWSGESLLVGQPREIKPRSTLRSRRELYKEYKADWEAFPDLRGTHVRRKPVRSGGYDLVTQDGLVLGRIFLFRFHGQASLCGYAGRKC